MVVGLVIGDMVCRKATVTIPNEFGADAIVTSKSMFFYATIVFALVLIPRHFIIRKGFDTENNKKGEEI